MANWLTYLNQRARRQTFQPSFRPSFQPYTPRDAGGYNPTAVSRSSAPLFSPGARSSSPSVSAAAASPTKAAAPERFDLSLAYSPYRPAGVEAPKPVNTQGDFLASLNASLPQLDLANAIPWTMERVHELASKVAEDHPDNAYANAVDKGTGAFLDGFEQLSNVVAPVLDFIPNAMRDQQLTARARMYRSIVSGEPDQGGFTPLSGNPISTFAKFFNPGSAAGDAIGALKAQFGYGQADTGGMFGNTISGEQSQIAMYQSIVRNALSPRAKDNAELQLAILRDSIDLPESVKQAISANARMSDDELEKALSAAPEGRMWSYDPGLKGIVANVGNPLIIYGAEAKGLGDTAAGLNSVGGEVGSALISRGGAAARAGRGLQLGVEGAAKLTTMAAKLQKAYMLSGLGVGALTTGMETIARIAGNQEAIDWWTKVNQPGEFAENPNVQLVTGFTVNPFEAIGAAKRGIVKLGHGAGDVVLGKTLGERFVKAHDSDELIYGTLAKMYRLSGVDEAKEFAAKYYDNRGEVFDEVVGQAANRVLEQQLPREERLSLLAQYKDPIDLTKHVLQTYGPQIMDVLEHQSDEVAQGWFRDHWQYHQYPGAFDPDVAALNAKDYRLAKGKSYVLRQQLDAVTAYREHLSPEGTAQARLWLEANAKDGSVPIKGVGGLQDLVRRFPAMRKYWQGLVKPGDAAVSKEAVETMIQRAEADYATASKQNPVKVRTGADPVIRPDSPRRDFDRADALGTDVQTVKAIDEGTPEHIDLYRKFIADKGLVEPEVAATMDFDTAWKKALEYVYNTEKPWVEAGERVAAAEKRIEFLKADLRRLEAIPNRGRTAAHADAIATRRRELETLFLLTREASDPIVPFAEDIALERSSARRADRVRAMNPDKLSASDATFLRRYLTDAQVMLPDKLTGRDLWEAAKEVADKAPRVSGRDIALANRATRKVEAMAALDRLAEIDAGTTILGFDGTSHWPNLIRRTPEGEWGWTGGGPIMTESMRRSVARILYEKGHRGDAATMLEYGDEEAWSVLIHKHPDVLQDMTRTQRAAVSRAIAEGAGKTTLDEYVQAAIDASGEDLNESRFLERLAALAEEREAILDSTGASGALRERNLVKQAGMDVPVEYVREAEADLQSRSIYYDPEFDARIHPENVAKVAEILANPSELYPSLSSYVKADPILEAGARKVAMEEGTTLDQVLRDPTYAGRLKTELVPPDFAPPEAGLFAETELDQLVLDDDAAAIAQRSAEVRAAADIAHDPIKTTVSSAQKAGVRPTRQYRELLAQYGADITEAPSAAILDDPANRYGLDVLSVLNHGGVGTKPATVRGTLALLEAIEHGAGTRMGFGARAQAEAQRVARLIVRDAILRAKRLPFTTGTFGPGLDPASFAFDEWTLARELPMEELRADFGRRTVTGAEIPTLIKTLKGTLSNREIAAGKEAMSQRVNEAVGLARGAEEGTGGATRAGGFAERRAAFVKAIEDVQNGRPAIDPDTGQPLVALTKEHALKSLRDRMAALTPDDAAGAARPAEEAARTGGRISFEDGAIKAELSKNVEITYAANDPLGTLQYGFKKRPKAAVVMELSKVPTLAEEFVSERFHSWDERVWTSKVRQAYNYVFGPLSNTSVRGAVHQRFVDRLAVMGIDGDLAESIWKRWQDEADNSRSPEIRVDEQGRRSFSRGDNPLYASPANIPSKRMDQWAHETLVQELMARNEKGLLDPAYLDAARKIDYSTVFREASSFTRRTLKDVPTMYGHPTLGKALAAAYGTLAHNNAVTTLYYWFRFGLDVRYHAMNFFEAQLLYLGRAGLRRGEIDNGMLGQTEGFLRKLDQDYIDNTGYATSRSRFAYAYRTFLKEQPDALRGRIKGLQAEDPGLMGEAMRQMAEVDPELRSLIRDMGDTPDGWMKALDAWYKKMLDTVSEADGDIRIDEALAQEIAKTPAMAEVYGALAQANKDLWKSVRETFYGNPNRSRAERFLNSYLLFWPLSYQIKSTKWLLKVLYDRAGGIQTNGVGAVLLDRVAQTHQQLLATDQEYRDWYERHPTMAFVAQMLMPITPDSIGVSLNPALRSIFFGRSKAFWDIGPIYTVNHVVRPLGQELGADLYPMLRDVPAMDGLWRATFGAQPKDPTAPSWAQD